MAESVERTINLTAKQYEIVKLIWEFRKNHGIAPTLAELATTLDVSKITVHEHITLLEKKKALTKEKYQSRSLRLTRKMERELEGVQRERQRSFVSQDQGSALPLLGRIAAGEPIDADELPEEADIRELVHFKKASYILQVKGDSMIDAGIHDGDHVLVERRSIAHDRDIVVAVLEDNVATLKRFFRQGRSIRLEPANESLEPIITDKVEIRGVVVGVMRRY